jgi:hypothetical protein
VVRRFKLDPVVRVGGRSALWAAVLLLLVRGALDLVAGVAPAAEQLVRERAPAMRVHERDAAAFAAGFARAYLTFSPAQPERHAQAVTEYASPWLGEHAGLELPPRGRSQSVLDAEPARVLRLDRSRLLITVAVELAPPRPRPVYLTVPIEGSATGALTVVDYPSFSPPPRHAVLREPQRPALQARARAEIEDLLRRFFPLYLSGRSDELAYFLPAGRALDALGSRYRFLELASLEAADAERSKHRLVLARIRVRDEHTHATYLLGYRLELERRDRWYVAAINTV